MTRTLYYGGISCRLVAEELVLCRLIVVKASFTILEGKYPFMKDSGLLIFCLSMTMQTLYYDNTY